MIKQEIRDKFDIPQHAVLFTVRRLNCMAGKVPSGRITAQKFTAINEVCVWLKGR